MITKIGAGIVKEALFGTITGAVRAGNLTPEESRTLEKEYGLREDANLALRNAGRGLVGGNLGALGGMAVGK